MVDEEDIHTFTRVRLISKHAARLAVYEEEEQISLTHIGNNSRVCGERPADEIRMGMEFLPGLEMV